MANLALTKNDIFFKKLEKNRESIGIAYKKIIQNMNTIISDRNLDMVASLIEYIEYGQGAITLEYINEVHDILRILRIIEIENKFNVDKCLIIDNCSDFRALYEKYHKICFALWRRIFNLSDISVMEADIFIRNNHIDIYAVLFIAQDVMKLNEDEAIRLWNVMTTK